MNFKTLLLAAAVICFALSAIGVQTRGVNLQSLGLALGFASFLV